ncbi:molybdopterin molybdenumtransferase MoeA [Parashewanella spongiae]|uniref:Molybdopterin molybdenumtransferase n=1 Tax=Parashewanella spongiae TaxID=342950 RepID=A0A3A6TGX6_9GAMM|nr:gephyrin-like molybdotransferase Glp [Parashewanella spongiae]MCL1079857.1 molybdopterin molybdotransferase MoeA [Parashewanella spongiae]RJY06766.1 molybdopterin molybdenumtransferase MoeA [Parashewanella spongiae]
MPSVIDPCALPELIHPDDALPMLLKQVNTISETTTLDLADALDFVLAGDIQSSINLPPFDNSAMDGYAFRFSDLDHSLSITSLTLVGTALAGHPFSGELHDGCCIRIMTGAPVPNGLDTVQMQELTQAKDNRISITHPKKQGANIRTLGEEVNVGQTVLSKGTRIRAAELGVLATLGMDKVSVIRKLKVAFFSTGDELKPVGTELKKGQIYDSNRYSIKGLLSKAQVEWLDLGIIEDCPQAIEQAFNQAAQQADLVLTSGGVSVGDADHVKQVLDKVGEITFWRLAMKPGKPFAMGKLNNAIFCGLPGNPVASMVTFYQLVMPLIEKMQGQGQNPRLKVQAILTNDIRRKPGRVEYQRGVLTYDNQGQLSVATTGAQGSGMLTSMSTANCFIHIPREQGQLLSGETVIVEPFNFVLS